MIMFQQMNFSFEPWNYTGSANYYDISSSDDTLANGIIRVTKNINNSFDLYNVGKYSVYEIADWFLCKSDMTHKKLQKLCYYAQAWCYAIKGYRLINSDFEAWVHGPVSPALWEKFKRFGYSTISFTGNRKFEISPEDLDLLNDVWETYGEYTGNALEALSHRELPWIEARKGYAENERCTVAISPKSMATYYSSIYSGS